MAENSSNSINYYLVIRREDEAEVASIRHWKNLKVAFEKDYIWITNFELVQIDSVVVKSIPYKLIYYSKDGKLYLKNSLLPEQNEPNMLWTPIERAFPLRIYSYNHNYFGIEERIPIKLVQDENIKEARVMLSDTKALKEYIEVSAEVRVKKLEWTVVNNNKVLIFGTPLLPIQGSTLWVKGQSIIPVGLNFELYILQQQIEKSMNVNGDVWIVWNSDSSYFKVDKTAIMPLTLSSFRKTIEKVQAIDN